MDTNQTTDNIGKKKFLTRPGYRERLIDAKITEMLRLFGAVSIDGPKWCGKTWTALNHVHSEAYLGKQAANSSMQNDYELAQINLRPILDREKPVLLDEWQDIDGVWDTVRHECDIQNTTGLYVLTGSATPRKPGEISHSGAGRIARVRMHTMTLLETGDSTGDVSLRQLFHGEDIAKEIAPISYKRLAELIIRGGWPESLDHDFISSTLAETYLDSTVKQNISYDGVRRDPEKMMFLIRSLARNESTVVSNRTLVSDINGKAKTQEEAELGRNTVARYLEVLNDLYLIEDQPAFSTNVRSPERIGVSKKRHLADTSLAVAALGLDIEGLMNDVRTFGFLFEALVEHDLRVYAEHLGGTLRHFRNNVSGLEIDAIVELKNGDYGAIEIKLGTDQIDSAVKNLNAFEKEVTVPPKFKAVICGLYPAAVKRQDGIYVFPITALRD